MKSNVPMLLPFVTLLAASALPGSAALIAYDSFAGYSAGQLVGQGNGFGWSGNWSGSTQFQVASTTLTHGSNSTNGKAMNTGTNTADGFLGVSRNFSTALPTTGDIYFGFLMQQPSGNAPRGAGLSFAGGTSKEVWAGTWNNQTQWQLARNIPTNSFSNTTTGINESTATVFFVAKLQLGAGNDTIRLFVNPANTAALSGAGNAVFTGSGFTDFAAPTGLSLFRQNLAGGGVGNVTMDEVRVGTAAADMFATIPEPSVALLGSLGLLALFRRRRA